MKLYVLFALLAGYCSAKIKLEFVQGVSFFLTLVDLYPIYEDDWVYGGGGLGELTGKGMGEMNELGRLFRKRYVNELHFLQPKYVSREVYIRSTDLNRTIISANSLAYGFFPPSLYDVPDVDYPFKPFKWQPGLTFVPIHVDGPDQCAAAQNCPCPRYDILQSEMLKLPEVLPKFQQVVLLNRQVAAYYNKTSGVDTFYEYPDTWKCQRAYFNTTLYQKFPWYNEQLYRQSQLVYAPVKGFLEGNFADSSVVNGVDIGHEMRVLNCSAQSNCSSYLKKLKFYGYSFHDNNVYAALVALGIPQLTNTDDGWPAYASGILLEFYRDTETNDNFFKVLYRESDDTEIVDVTNQVPICNGTSLCPLSALQTLAQTLKPLPDITTLCNSPVF
uniref:Acid phosphatase n=1 Tax=Caenorhabditis japonica TaxID=281687 RepID=A0A8R1E461_CAEJA